MKMIAVIGAGLLALVFTGCVQPVGYGGSYGAVYGEYPSTYTGSYYVEPSYSYVYPSYGYGPGYRGYGYRRPWVPYDRDHFYDRGHYWDRHAYGHGRDHDRDDHRRRD